MKTNAVAANEPAAPEEVIARLERQVQELEEALVSRATIDQAKGVIMATCRCGPEDAFRLLQLQSQYQNRKLRDIAREMVAHCQIS